MERATAFRRRIDAPIGQGCPAGAAPVQSAPRIDARGRADEVSHLEGAAVPQARGDFARAHGFGEGAHPTALPAAPLGAVACAVRRTQCLTFGSATSTRRRTRGEMRAECNVFNRMSREPVDYQAEALILVGSSFRQPPPDARLKDRRSSPSVHPVEQRETCEQGHLCVCRARRAALPHFWAPELGHRGLRAHVHRRRRRERVCDAPSRQA